jgi:hypothetical protein
LKVDRLAFDMGQFTLPDIWADFTGDCNFHSWLFQKK